MKKLLTLSLVILIASLISIVLFSYITGDPTYPKSVIQTVLHSTILDEDRKVSIHLPRYYDPNKQYPVIYVLDGSSQDIHIAKKFDILSAAEYAPETIIVGLPNVSGKGRQRDYTPPYMRMDIDEQDSPLGAGDKFLSFIEKELFPFMEKNYAVSEYRSLAGNSRGGLLVVYSLLYKPNMFTGRFCFSPAFWRDDNLIVDKASDFLISEVNWSSFLYMSLGDGENEKMKKGFDKMTNVLRRKVPNQLTWYSEFTKNAGHRNNAEISASRAIRKWTNYLEKIN